MNLRTLFATTIFTASLPGLAATSCPAPQVLVGSNCTLTTGVGWGIAGLGTDTIMTIYVPPTATGPVNFHVAAMRSNLGSAYTGYFGLKVQETGGTAIISMAEILAGNDIGDVSPGNGEGVHIIGVCWDPTCTAAAPPGAVPNMFSAQIVISSPNSADIDQNWIQLSVRFLDGKRVTYVTQETALQVNGAVSRIPGINLGATPASTPAPP